MRTHPDYDIQALAVLSEESMIPLCDRFGVRWIMHENLPLGAKKNAGLNAAREIEFDYMMEIGSDTLVLNELLDEYKTLDLPFFGVGECAFIDSETMACRYVNKSSMYGGGRMIRRDTLEKMNFSLWKPGISRGLDGSSVFNCSMQGIKYRQMFPSGFPKVIDIKSEENIWPFNYCWGKEFDVNLILEKLSEPEREMIYAAVESQHR